MGLAALDRCAEQVLRSQLGVSVAGLPRVLWTMNAMACIIAIARNPARGQRGALAAPRWSDDRCAVNDELRPSDLFFANNVAFRKPVFDANPLLHFLRGRMRHAGGTAGGAQVLPRLISMPREDSRPHVLMSWFMDDSGRFGRAYEQIATHLALSDEIARVLCLLPADWTPMTRWHFR